MPARPSPYMATPCARSQKKFIEPAKAPRQRDDSCPRSWPAGRGVRTMISPAAMPWPGARQQAGGQLPGLLGCWRAEPDVRRAARMTVRARGAWRVVARGRTLGVEQSYFKVSRTTRLLSLTMPASSGLSTRASAAPSSLDIRVSRPRGLSFTGTTSPRI
jgi:hypothetical protein